MKLRQILLDLLYCGSALGMDRDWLCEDCRVALSKRWVGAAQDPGLDGMAISYRYAGPAGSVVRRMKFHGVAALSEIMVPEMLRAYPTILPTGADCVIAVPMHPKRLRRRGYNHSQILADAIAKELNLPCLDALRRTRNTRQQSLLTVEERRTNLKDAFAADERVRGRRILLIDDVYTTGETARECAKALRQAGAASVYLLAYAMGHQKDGD